MYPLARLVLVAAAGLGACCLAVLAALTAPWSLVVVAVVASGRLVRRGRRSLWAHGTARWADAADLRHAGMLDGTSGLILGRSAGVRRPPLAGAIRALFGLRHARVAVQNLLAAVRIGRPEIPLVRMPAGIVHTVVFAPTGSGKGVSLVIPFLLTCDDSCVVIDFKGDLARLTADARRRKGHAVVLLDPYTSVTRRPALLNPLDFIDPASATALDDCNDLAEALVARAGTEAEPHWNDSAQIWIAAMTACTVCFAQDGERSLQSVRTLLTDPRRTNLAIQALGSSPAWDGMLARLGHQLTHAGEKERGSVLTTANRHLAFLDTPAIVASTSASSFNPADLNRGGMTVYLVLPPDRMRAQAGLLRMWVNTLLRAVVRGGLREKNRVHFVLDEAAALGKMDSLHDAVDKYRAYGVRCQFYYQSMGQLKRCWPEDQGQTLLGNTSQVFFAVNDPETAAFVSTRLGEETIAVASGGTNTGTSHTLPDGGCHAGSTGRSAGDSRNWSQAARKLLKPEEVLALSERTAVTFVAGVPPVATTLLRYYEEKSLGRRPGPLRRTLAALRALTLSLFVLAGVALVALALSLAVGGPQPVLIPSSPAPQEPPRASTFKFFADPNPKGR
jgi:type IV secretion system protein VirD4